MLTPYGKHILMIEDEEPLARSVKWLLESAGFTVQTELTGKGGLAYASEHRPDLVILDIRLPDVDGYQVCRALRKLYRPWVVPVLMLTAMDKPVDQLRGFAHGTDAYLTKPFESSELVQTVALLLDESVPT